MKAERERAFECFGGLVRVRIAGPGAAAERALIEAEATLVDAHRRLSRFLPGSELNRLNRDPRSVVPASPLLLELAAAAGAAGELSRGLVDATLLAEIERAGYRESLSAAEPGARALAITPPRPVAPIGAAPSGPFRPAAAARGRAWSRLRVDREAGTIARPPGVELDSGGLAKGLLADRVGLELESFPAYAVECCGDLRIGGRAGATRTILVEDPAGGDPLHRFELRSGGIATSGIGKRSWADAAGERAHHLLDPASGRPAHTGVVQATALAPSALLAEVHAKWALLGGPELAPSRLPHGGLLVLEDGSAELVEPAAATVAVAA